MINFQEVAEAFEVIANTSSTNEKERLLVKYADLKGFKEIMKFIYNPYIVTGLKKNKLGKAPITGTVPDVEDMLEYYNQSRTGTQDEAALAMNFIETQETAETYWLANGMMTKDLQIGVSVTTLNKVYGKGFIPTVGIMRGMHAPEKFSGIYIATEKIDGNRRLIMRKDNHVEIYTRSGRRDYGLVDIEQEAMCLPPGFVYDSELAAVGDYADSIELRQATASIANSKGKRSGVRALCFDMVKQADFDIGVSKMAAVGRKALLASIFGDHDSYVMLHKWFAERDMQVGSHLANSINAISHSLKQAEPTPHIMPLPILGIVTNREEAMALAQPIWDTGGEGIMLVEYLSAYEVNPNPRNTLLKIKATKEYTLRCVNVLEHKNGDMLGSVTVEYFRKEDGKTYLVDVGSGFCDYDRIRYWNNSGLIIGKMLELESFGESRNAAGSYSLNCPIFKRIAGEKE